jgi:hypothetical protein
MPLVRVIQTGKRGGVDRLACGHDVPVSPFNNYSKRRRCPTCPPKPLQTSARGALLIRRLTSYLEGEHSGGENNRHPDCVVCQIIEEGRNYR